MSSITKDNFPLLVEEFLTLAFVELERKKFHLQDHWHIDHLCYRTSTQENYATVTQSFARFSKLLIESEVNGRLISTFQLATPISYGSWQIDLIEVPAPKRGKTVIDGFEHFEVVCDMDFAEIKTNYNGQSFDESGLSKDFNQELEVMFDGFAVKFHQISLESVIRLERNERVFSRLKSSQILKSLRPFHPLIVGTFPLDLHVAGSDLDILVSGEFEVIQDVLTKNFASTPGFQVRRMMVQGQASMVVNLSVDGIAIEVFAQNHSATVRQHGFLHFLAEERLLKLGGTQLHKKIQRIRERGVKTEPAFTEALGLKGDPYGELLTLQKMSNLALVRLVARALSEESPIRLGVSVRQS